MNIGPSMGGIQRNTEMLNAAHNRIAQGEVETENIVDSKIAQRGIEANLTAVKTIMETEEAALDILA